MERGEEERWKSAECNNSCVCIHRSNPNEKRGSEKVEKQEKAKGKQAKKKKFYPKQTKGDTIKG